MKTLYLPTGPRGAGKSTLTNAVMKKYPHILLVSRDNIMYSLQKSLCLDMSDPEEMTELYMLTEQKMFIELRDVLEIPGEAQIILDCFTLFADIRKKIVGVLKASGVNRIVCWNLITPMEISEKWFFAREKITHLQGELRSRAENEYRFDYENYHTRARNISNEGFDTIHTLDMSSFLDLSEIT